LLKDDGAGVFINWHTGRFQPVSLGKATKEDLVALATAFDEGSVGMLAEGADRAAAFKLLLRPVLAAERREDLAALQLATRGFLLAIMDNGYPNMRVLDAPDVLLQAAGVRFEVSVAPLPALTIPAAQDSDTTTTREELRIHKKRKIGATNVSCGALL
jgi:hypothetical protein